MRRAGRARLAGVMVAGALVLLLAAVVVAAVVVLRWHQLAVATETGAPADEQIAAGTTADLSWLENAMSGCDDEAKADPETLHFLVTPLVPATGGIEPWRAKSISDAGNGIVLRSNDTFDGLKSGTLRIYPADYAFSVFDPVRREAPQMAPLGRRDEVLDRRGRPDLDLQGAVPHSPQRRRRRLGQAASIGCRARAIG